MAQLRPKWSTMAVTAGVFAGVTLGFLGWWRSQRLAEEHAMRAQKALDEMSMHYYNIKFTLDEFKRAKRPTDKARYEAIMKTSRHRLVKLEEAAVRHERLARYYGHKAPLKHPEPDPKLDQAPSQPPKSR